MDRKRMSDVLPGTLRAAGKYKYAAAVVLLGVLLMLLPAGRSSAQSAVPEVCAARGATEREMEATLAAFDGVGRLRLTLAADAQTERWIGAVVVCEGAESAAVRLELTRAVAALTGLSTEKIAIVRGKP